ncbi:hypothetical protein [Gracilibacillus lacisalsi]|uniref:hypothetical protein n=1 Tax=Gracilibacillus lacisalsi TaxID=393087 RepID=UPI00037FEAF8|nr:hypothetical protein [Gracilibacillus lacisalsi]
MNYDEERKRLIEEDQEFISFPPPDYSKMSNEQIRFRTKLMKEAFKKAFDEHDQYNEDDDEYI